MVKRGIAEAAPAIIASSLHANSEKNARRPAPAIRYPTGRETLSHLLISRVASEAAAAAQNLERRPPPNCRAPGLTPLLMGSPKRSDYCAQKCSDETQKRS